MSKSVRIVLVGAASLASAIGMVQLAKSSSSGSKSSSTAIATALAGDGTSTTDGSHRLASVAEQSCQEGSIGIAAKKQSAATGNPKARRAAQLGLTYLAKATSQWQDRNNCYGCHVQAVTLKALAVGRHHQYDVGQQDLDTVLKGMLDLPGGARHATGLGYQHTGDIYNAGKIFGVSAFARFDQLVSERLEKELLSEAESITAFQAADGSVTANYLNAPVSTGTVQFTAEALVTWRQAFERSADPKWHPYISKSEDYLRGVVHSWKKTPTSSVQELNYAIVGLLAAGVGGEEDVLQVLGRRLREFQNTDGGFALQKGSTSGAFATGQSLYALRSLGASDNDKDVARGTNWLIAHQSDSGTWSEQGFGKAEAMWGVLGLVSMDVLSIAVEGIKDGSRVDGLTKLHAVANDNGDQGVRKLELRVDDILVASHCGDVLDFNLDTKALSDGMHVIDLQATNHAGKVSRRLFEVYAGDVYMTQLGSKFKAGTSTFSLRDIAPAGSVHIFNIEVQDETGAVVRTLKAEGAPGSMNIEWDGLDDKGSTSSSSKYLAVVSALDSKGAVLQRETMSFVHASEFKQKADWAQVGGVIALPSSAPAQNVEIELLDEDGKVVERTRSTRKGKYRFKNVMGKKSYKVRVRKDGFDAEPVEVAAEQGGEVRANVKLK